MNLYQIDKAYLDVIESGFSVDEETGELLFTEEDLDSLQAEYSDKVDNIACYIKDLDSLNDSISKEIKALQERKKWNDTKAERLKGYITSSMKKRGLNKLESARNKVSFRKSTSVQVIDESLVDDDYMKVKIERSVDKKKVSEQLKKGQFVAGCILVENTNIQIK